MSENLGVGELATATIESMFKSLQECSYRIDVDAQFVQQFFEDRRLISAATSSILQRDVKFQNLLNSAGLPLKLQLGTHLFGQSTVEEHFVLASLVRTLKPRQIVEVGVFRGQTALTMCRALQTCPAGSFETPAFTGIDIDKTAVAIAEDSFGSLGLSAMARFIAGDSNEVVPTLSNPDLVFIDGDHAFEAVVRDFVGAYNKVGEGGVIVMHDIGSKVWGYHQDPGWFFYRVLPDLLKDKILQSWLDSMCRELTMRLLSPTSDAACRYCEGEAEALELARLTSIDTINGAGGLGFALKLDGKHTLNLGEVLRNAPAPAKPTITTKVRKTSLFGRVARKIANWIP